MASVDCASLSVFGGNQEEAIVALEFEPTDIVDPGPAWIGVVLYVVGDGLRFWIDCIGAVVGEVTVEGRSFFFDQCRSPFRS